MYDFSFLILMFRLAVSVPLGNKTGRCLARGKSFRSYVVRRLLVSLFTLAGVLVLVFLLVHSQPPPHATMYIT
jgi:hypothetical protein